MVKYKGILKQGDTYGNRKGDIVKVVSITRGQNTWDVTLIYPNNENFEETMPCYDFEKLINQYKWKKIQ